MLDIFNFFILTPLSSDKELILAGEVLGLIKNLLEKIQVGLTLTDIENLLFFIIFIRFGILTIRYNLKTSLYITLIGLFAGYLWYRHLIDIILMYRTVLVKVPFFHSLGSDTSQTRRIASEELKLPNNFNWYNPGKIIYYAITKGIIHIDPETGLNYYMDPISMIISKLKSSIKPEIITFYYQVYNKIIPKIFSTISKFWSQLSGVVAYVVITRIGKRYCPYLIRWHWTFLLIMGLVEQVFISFIYRVYYFQTFVLLPKIQISNDFIDKNIIFQINISNGIIACIVFTHIGFVIFALLHAICGQYFYIPFFVENTELHIGLRPKNSIYSGGHTIWQNREEKNIKRVFPKLWFGWFGSGYTGNFRFFTRLIKILKILTTKLKKYFRN